MAVGLRGKVTVLPILPPTTMDFECLVYFDLSRRDLLFLKCVYSFETMLLSSMKNDAVVVD